MRDAFVCDTAVVEVAFLSGLRVEMKSDSSLADTKDDACFPSSFAHSRS